MLRTDLAVYVLFVLTAMCERKHVDSSSHDERLTFCVSVVLIYYLSAPASGACHFSPSITCSAPETLTPNAFVTAPHTAECNLLQANTR